MAARRLLAVALAALLVVGALLIRSLVRDDADPGDRTARLLICATELAAVCATPLRGIDDVVVEPAGDTLDRWARGDGPPAGTVWVTFQPFPAMLDELRSPGSGATSGSTSGAVTESIGSAGLAVALPADHRAVLDAHCAGQAWWRCVGAAAGTLWSQLGGNDGWGTVRPALGDAGREAVPLLALAHATAGYLGTTDIRRSDWEADPSFLPWVRRLVNTVPTTVLSGGTPYATLLTRPSALDLASTTSAEVARRRPPDTLTIAYPDPVMDARVVVRIAPGQAPPAGLLDELRGRASAAGWSGPSDADHAAPSPRTLLALRQLWIEAT
jgi:hypothetical protein